VEALSDDPLAEVRWVVSQAASVHASGIPHAIVAYANLFDEDVEVLLQQYAAIPSVKGIRQITNHHPTNSNLTWPKVDRDFWHDAQWINRFKLLAKYNLSFDAHLNPHQLKAAMQVFAAHSNIPVIINHLGCLHLGQGEAEDQKNIDTWRQSLRELSGLAHVSIKLSMLWFTKAGWPSDPETEVLVSGFVHEVINMFGTKRCMFASNLPVDNLHVAPDVLINAFKKIVSNLSESDQQDLFYNTAERIYHL